MRRTLPALATLLALAGCGRAEDQRALDTDRCLGAGLRPGSNGFSNCMMQIALDRDAPDAATGPAATARARAETAEQRAKEDRKRAELAEQRARDARRDADLVKQQVPQ